MIGLGRLFPGKRMAGRGPWLEVFGAAWILGFGSKEHSSPKIGRFGEPADGAASPGFRRATGWATFVDYARGSVKRGPLSEGRFRRLGPSCRMGAVGGKLGL